MHLAKPVELPVKSEVLENAEDADEKAEKHPEPNEAAPVLERSKGLRRKEEEDDIGQEEEKLHACAVRRGSAVKEPLGENDD